MPPRACISDICTAASRLDACSREVMSRDDVEGTAAEGANADAAARGERGDRRVRISE